MWPARIRSAGRGHELVAGRSSAIEAELADWLAASTAGRGTVRLDWLILRGDDRARLAGRRNPPDVLLGGPASAFDRLAGMNRLSPLPLEGSPSWSVARRSSIRLAGPSPRPGGELGPRGRDGPIIAIDDPRNGSESKFPSHSTTLGPGCSAHPGRKWPGGGRNARQA